MAHAAIPAYRTQQRCSHLQHWHADALATVVPGSARRRLPGHRLGCRRSAPHAAAIRQRRRQGTLARTSADWWEDELEYDAITEVLLPKVLHLVAADQADEPSTQRQLAPLALAGAFAAPSSQAAAEQLWAAIGKAGPPLFLKIRTRAALDELADPRVGADQASGCIDALLDELCLQSWRMELDAGLGQGEAASEQLLVLAPRAAIQQLAAAVAAASPSPPSSDGEGPAPCWRVALQGWNQGAASSGVCLESWRMLTPALQRGLAG